MLVELLPFLKCTGLYEAPYKNVTAFVRSYPSACDTTELRPSRDANGILDTRIETSH
jgi:hypothetical protein